MTYVHMYVLYVILSSCLLPKHKLITSLYQLCDYLISPREPSKTLLLFHFIVPITIKDAFEILTIPCK